MVSLNKVMVIGNLGSEPEMRFTPSGKPVTSFSVAASFKSGETETTEWFSIVTWEKLAELCNRYLTKGQQVYVEGRLQTKTWEADGVKHYKAEVIAGTVLFLGQQKHGESTEETF